MSRRDYRCVLSGVSLLDSEVAVVFLQQLAGTWRPMALPLFGLYEGTGTVGVVNDGPNADLILAALQQGVAGGRIVVDFVGMGLVEQTIDHIETLLSVVACSQIEGDGRIHAEEGALGFALLAAHVAAAAMAEEPMLPTNTQVEGLSEVVIDSELGRSIYRPLRSQTHRMRCKFGLSMVGLAALDQQMKARAKPWAPPGKGIPLEEARPALWLAEAMVEFAESASIIEALEDYAEQGEEDGAG